MGLTICFYFKDSGSRKKEAIAKIKVSILDENDNRPHFNINPILASIREDARIGQHVAFVSCQIAPFPLKWTIIGSDFNNLLICVG